MIEQIHWSQRGSYTVAKRNTRIAIEPLTRVTRSGRQYHRTPEVDAQIASGLRLSPSALVARARVRDHKASEFLKEECLVYFIRMYHQADDLDTVNALVQVLLERCTRRIMRRFCALGLNREDTLMAYHELVADMIEAIIDSESNRGEFFQVRFGRVLRYRLLNVYDKCIRANKRSQLHDSLTDSIGGESDFSDGPDEREQLEERIGSEEDLAMDAERHLAIQEALPAIRDERHREAFVLRHFEGWPLEADDPHEACLSRRFGVSVKTVHNWLRTAEADLAVWRETKSAR